MPDIDNLISTSEAAGIVGESVRQFIRRVEAGSIKPAKKLPGLRGAYLFERSDVERISSRVGASS